VEDARLISARKKEHKRRHQRQGGKSILIAREANGAQRGTQEKKDAKAPKHQKKKKKQKKKKQHKNTTKKKKKKKTKKVKTLRVFERLQVGVLKKKHKNSTDDNWIKAGKMIPQKMVNGSVVLNRRDPVFIKTATERGRGVGMWDQKTAHQKKTKKSVVLSFRNARGGWGERHCWALGGKRGARANIKEAERETKGGTSTVLEEFGGRGGGVGQWLDCSGGGGGKGGGLVGGGFQKNGGTPVKGGQETWLARVRRIRRRVSDDVTSWKKGGGLGASP